MNEVLKIILSMSFSGGIIITLLFLLAVRLEKKLSRQWWYYIWLIAVIRLLVPFAPQQNLMNMLFQKTEAVIGSIENGKSKETEEKVANEQTQNSEYEKKSTKVWLENEKTFGGVAQISEEKASGGETVKKESSVYLFFIRKHLWLLWLIPALILFIKKIICYRVFLKWIRAGSRAVHENAVLEHFGELLKKSHVRKSVSLSVNRMVASPMLIGFFHPCIILPSMKISDLEFENTILHELMHERRGDIFYKWLVQLTVCVHWFNPLVYVLQRSTNRACELSCDEAVIWNMDADGRCAYGDTLLCAAGRRVDGISPKSFLTFSNNKKHLKERLDAIMKLQKRNKGASILVVILTVLLSVSAAYTGVYAMGKEKVATKEKITIKGKTTAPNSSNNKPSPADAAQAPHSVLYKNGEYFILFDNAGEKDLPSSTGPDYGVTFGAVWPDTYVSFNSYYVDKKLSSKIKKECKHMKNKGWLTKKEANAIIDVALKVQRGDTNGFKTDKQENEYSKCNITNKNGVYYYKNRRIRILMDNRMDRSFKIFRYDSKGSVDLKIIRNKNNSIKKVKHISKKNAEAILHDMKE